MRLASLLWAALASAGLLGTLTMTLAPVAQAAEATAPRETESVAPIPWMRTLPLVRLGSGDAPRVLDLAAHCAELAEVTSAVPPAGPAPLFEITATSSPLDGAPTAICIVPVVSAGPANQGRELWTIRYTTRAGGAGELTLVADFQHRAPVEFSYVPPAGAAMPKRVAAAGTFNGWNAGSHPLAGPDADGRFTLTTYDAPAGARYKFVVDGNWQTDAGNPLRESDGMGGFNSIVAGTDAHAGRLQLLPAATDDDGESLEPNSARYLLQREAAGTAAAQTPARVLLLGGNQVLATWPRAMHDAADDVEGIELEVEDNQIELVGLDAADALAPDGILRLMATDDLTSTAPLWADATIHRAPSGPMAPDWRGRTIYFAFTDRFHDGNPDNNKKLAPPLDPTTSQPLKLNPIVEYHGGDWAGLRKQLEAGYFDQLGVGALWISAPNRQPEQVKQESVPPRNWYTAYHGYWPDSPTETNPHFGTLEELRALVKAAHARDILVLLDLVANHVYEDHPWVRQHPEWFSPLLLPDGRQNIRLFDEQPFTTWFETFLPSFAFGERPEAVEAVAQNAVWWVQQTGIDGFRQDAVKHIEPTFWRALTRKLRDQVELPEGRRLYQVGESISGRPTINAFIGADMLDGQFDFPLYWPIRGAVAGRANTMRDLAAALRESEDQYPSEALMSPLIGNHDFARFMAYADGDLVPDGGVDEKAAGWPGTIQAENPWSFERIKLAHALLHALPGAPMIYYGDEIGLSGGGDPDNRRMLRFGAALKPQEAHVLDAVRMLGRARKASPALRAGTYQELLVTDDQLVFARISSGRTEPAQTVIVALNRSETGGPVKLDAPLPANLLDAAQGGRSLRRIYPADGGATAEFGPTALLLTLPVASASYFVLE